MRRVLILGGGISGLSLAWYLRNQCEVVVAEASNRVGGWIQTSRQDGFLFERGPHSFRTAGHGATTLTLLDELDLTSQVITADSTDQFIFYQNIIQKVPKSLFSFLTSPLTRDLLPSLWREWRAPRGTQEETVQTFAERRFGAVVAMRFMDPMVSGIYAGDPAKLSLQACFPQIHEMEQQYGSLIRAALLTKRSRGPRVVSLREGMQCLTDTLAARLGNRVQLGKEAVSIAFGDGVQVSFADGTVHAADHLCVAIPAWQLAQILPIPQLTQIPFASVAAVNLGYRRKILSHKGFGYLVPASETSSILGVIWDSEVFPQQNQHLDETRVTVMLGGVRRPDLLERSEEQLIQLAREAVSDLEPDRALVTRAHRAIPQYERGFSSLLTYIRAACPGSCTLIGNSYNGVSVNDCIHQAWEVSKLLSKKERVP